MTFERIIKIMSMIENIMDEENITIYSDEREGNDNEAHLYGSPYYQIEELIKKEISKNAYLTNYELVLKGFENLAKENEFSFELIKKKIEPLIHYEKIINFFDDNDEWNHFLENCTCSEQKQKKVLKTGNINFCKCKSNKNHILRSVVYLETLL